MARATTFFKIQISHLGLLFKLYCCHYIILRLFFIHHGSQVTGSIRFGINVAFHAVAKKMIVKSINVLNRFCH